MAHRIRSGGNCSMSMVVLRLEVIGSLATARHTVQVEKSLLVVLNDPANHRWFTVIRAGLTSMPSQTLHAIEVLSMSLAGFLNACTDSKRHSNLDIQKSQDYVIQSCYLVVLGGARLFLLLTPPIRDAASPVRGSEVVLAESRPSR